MCNNILKRLKVKYRSTFLLKNSQFNFTITLALVSIFILSSLIHPSFLEKNNFINILSYASVTGVLAIAVTLVLIVGGIDFSVASIAIMSAVAGGVLIQNITKSFFIIFLVTIATGALLGLINGVAVRYLSIPSFIVTLSMYITARAGAVWLSNGLIIYIKNVPGYILIAQTRVFKIPSLVLIFIFILIVFLILLRYTSFGKTIYAIGGNANAAYLSGIKTNRWKITLFVISGTLSAIAGIIGCSQIGQIDPLQWGKGYEMVAFSIALLGGASLLGGRGSMEGTLQAAIIMGILSNIMNLFSVSIYFQKVALGVILILLVFFDAFTKRGVAEIE